MSDESTPNLQKRPSGVKSDEGDTTLPSPLTSSAEVEEVLHEAETLIKPDPKLAKEVADYHPFQDLFETAITIRYGDDLQESCVVHLELLRCYSESMGQLFANAEEMRECYNDADKIRKRIKRILGPEIKYHDKFDVREAMEIIDLCMKHYPIPEFKKQVAGCLAQETDDYFDVAKNFKLQSGQGVTRKREHPRSEVKSRLDLMFPKVTFEVTVVLFKLLVQIKSHVAKSTEQNQLKAAAGRFINLRYTDSKTVHSMVHWIYRQQLHIQSADHLYRLQRVANQLGIVNLSATCLSKLSAAACSAINFANDNDISIRFLLNEKTQDDPPNEEGISQQSVSRHSDILRTVFNSVLSDSNAPEVLQDLVVDVIARSKDSQLMQHFQNTMKDCMLKKLNIVLMKLFSNAAKQIKGQAEAKYLI